MSIKNVFFFFALSLLLMSNTAKVLASSDRNYEPLNATLPGAAQRKAWAQGIKNNFGHSNYADQEIVRQTGDYSNLDPVGLSSWINRYNKALTQKQAALREKQAAQQASQKAVEKVSSALRIPSPSPTPSPSSIKPLSPSSSSIGPSADDIIQDFIREIERRERENTRLFAALREERDRHKDENARLATRIRELEDTLSRSGGSSSGADSKTAEVIQGLRDEIARLGGSTKAADAQTLPALNSPFVYPNPSVGAFDIRTTPVGGKVIAAIAGINTEITAINTEINTIFPKVVVRNLRKRTIDELNASLANPSAIDWDTFEKLSTTIKGLDFKPIESNANYIKLKSHIEDLARLQPTVQKAQEASEYTLRQNTYVEEFRNADKNLDPAVQALMATIPSLKELKLALEKAGDIVLSPKLQTLINDLEKGDLKAIEFFLKEALKPLFIPNQELMRQGIIRTVGANMDLYNKFFEAWENYKRVLATIPTEVSQNVLSLYAIESGRAKYARAVSYVVPTDLPSSIRSDTDIVLKSDPFSITGEKRTEFQDALNRVINNTDFVNTTNPSADAFKELFFSYNQVFDAASKLYFIDNAPQKVTS